MWLGDIPVASIRTNSSGTGVGFFYVHTDHLNTPTMLTQPSTNTIVWRWDRDPFGTTPPNTDPDANGLQLPFNQRFPGQTAFDESGLNYNYFRDYDPQTGRYVESDPIGLKGGVSTYGYVGANPLSRVDPKGEYWWWVIPGIVLAYEAISEGWQVYQLQDCIKKCVANSCNDDGTSRMPGSTEGDTRPNLACRQRCTLNIYGKPNGPGPLWPVSR